MIAAIPGKPAHRGASSNTLASEFVLGGGTPRAFKGMYCITSLANLRRCIAAWRRRKQAIQDMAVEVHARVQS
jgi:hypothetical protein